MNRGNWLIGACCALFVAVIVTPTGVYDGVWNLATGKDAPAWVQAIGSVAAIAAAVIIARDGIVRADKARARDAADKVEIAWHLVGQLVETMQVAQNSIRSSTPSAMDPANFNTAMQALNEVRLIDLPDGHLAIQFVSIRRCGEFYKLHYEEFVRIVNLGNKGKLERDEVEMKKVDPMFDLTSFRAFKQYTRVLDLDRIFADAYARFQSVTAIKDKFRARAYGTAL